MAQTGFGLTPSPSEQSDGLLWNSSSSTESRASTGSSVSLSQGTYPTGSWPQSFAPADLYLPIEETVLPLFFNSYLYLPKDPHVRNGFIEYLPMVLANTSPGSHFQASLMAVAFFSVAAWTGQAYLLRASEKYFLGALPKLRDALASDLNSKEHNLVLISILLLSTYEVRSTLIGVLRTAILHMRQEFVAIKDWKSPPKAHLRGAIALINSKKKPQGEKTALTSPLYHAVQGQIVRNTRGTTNPMVPKPEIWPLAQASSSQSPRNLLSTVSSAIVELRYKWDSIRKDQPDESQLISLLNQATQVDISLFSWSFSLPDHWLPVAATIIPQSVRDAGMYRTRCDCYNDLWIGATWNTYRDCRMLVQSIIIKCLRLLPSADPEGDRSANAQKVIQSLADDVCGSVPYFLGNQVESVRMVSDLIQYPFAEERPVTTTHKMAAPLMGPWHLFTFLRNLHTSDFGLPPEQSKWVEMQMERVLTIYFQR